MSFDDEDFKEPTENFPKGFSPFSWTLAAFCFPIALWPLALLLSPALLENTNIPLWQSRAFSFFFWFYPFVLGVIARILYKFHQNQPRLTRNILLAGIVIFWICVGIIGVVGLG